MNIERILKWQKSMIGFYQLPINYLDKLQQRIEAVTVASIKDAFKRRVIPKFIHTITVGGDANR